MKPLSFVVIVALGLSAGAQTPLGKGEPTTRTLTFAGGEGVFAHDGATPRPAVLIAAPAAAVKQRALQFAKLGYAALAIETVPNDRTATTKRIDAALEALSKQPNCIAHKTVGVGYGIGGAVMLDMTRQGADLLGVVAFHADIAHASKTNAAKIAARILLLSGSGEPLDKLTGFEREMSAARADWDMIRYGGVVGDFTDPRAKTYDADADARGHAAVKQFLLEVFPPPRSLGQAAPSKPSAPAGVPNKALRVLAYFDEHDRTMDGYEGGRSFGNFERRLAATDRTGRRIRYQEWDVNPLRPGVNRGAERLITGSDGSAYYTDDHYSTFKKIR